MTRTGTASAVTGGADDRPRDRLAIDVWTDFACPACYLAKPRLDAAMAATGRAGDVVVRYRAWELFPDATGEPVDSLAHVIDKFGGDEAQAVRRPGHAGGSCDGIGRDRRSRRCVGRVLRFAPARTDCG